MTGPRAPASVLILATGSAFVGYSHHDSNALDSGRSHQRAPYGQKGRLPTSPAIWLFAEQTTQHPISCRGQIRRRLAAWAIDCVRYPQCYGRAYAT
jgi:hypothetical protein